jgi:hypothetical protein
LCSQSHPSGPAQTIRIPPLRSRFNAKIRNVRQLPSLAPGNIEEDGTMDGLIYLIGLIVVIMAILSFFGLR